MTEPERTTAGTEIVKVFVRKPVGMDDSRVLSFRPPAGMEQYFLIDAQTLMLRGIALDGNQWAWTVGPDGTGGYRAPWADETRASLTEALATDEMAILRFFVEHGFPCLIS